VGISISILLLPLSFSLLILTHKGKMSLRATSALRNVARRAAVAPRAVAPVMVARRHNSGQAPPPPPPPKSGGNGIFIALGLAALAGGGYYYYSQQEGGASASSEKTKEDYQKVYNAIAAGLEKEGYDDGSLAPVVLRLAWHASGTYDKDTKTGGSNYATMRFPTEAGHGANAGLHVARDYMEGIKKQFPWISYGDLWTLGGVAAIQETGGPTIPWRPGRVDGFEVNQTPDGRLPDASQGSKHLRDIFYRMGFNDREIVALAGAHALGRCHTDRSGYDGPWTFSPVTFSNQFYDLLLNDGWQWKKWKGPAQYEDKKTKSLMMLPTDMSLVTDPKFKPVVQEYAKDEEAFFKDFAKAFATLLELGVPEEQWKGKQPYTIDSA
jgi:cytochrome c peroxidase